MQIPSYYRKNKHLYLRAGFGLNHRNWSAAMARPAQAQARAMVREAVRYSGPQLSETDHSPFQPGVMQQMLPESRQAFFQAQRAQLQSLNIAWLRQMARSPHPLREKMILFWQGHFACRLNLAALSQRQHNTLRQHALGKFGDLLIAISRDPGMLQFLNNQQNRKAHPNENFARELLELFTLGRGHYTEHDVQEAARAFTGWGFNREGEFVFRRRQHDYGTKDFLGQQGDFDGGDILRIILQQKRCAYFLTEKLYRFFVHTEPHPEQVAIWAERLYASDYDLADLLEAMFKSDHFYAEPHLGTHIKSPVEWLVGLMQHLDLDFAEDQALLMVQKVLNQVLFTPPNVAGWPNGKAWIDSSSLMARLTLPKAFFFADKVPVNLKKDFAGNEDLITLRGNRVQKLKAQIAWTPLWGFLRASSWAQMTEQSIAYLLQADTRHLQPEVLARFSGGQLQEDSFRMLCLRLICSPEYQLA